MDHRTLCTIAVDWLKRPASRKGPGCNIALSESGNNKNREIPDAIGWRPYGSGECASTIVEVKISRADFLSDRKKAHRQDPASGMGMYRYYMAPQGLLQIDEMPERWGLLEVSSNGRIIVRSGHALLLGMDATPWQHERNTNAEMSTLTLALARVGDAERLQGWLREANRRASGYARQAEALREEVRSLRERCRRLEPARLQD